MNCHGVALSADDSSGNANWSLTEPFSWRRLPQLHVAWRRGPSDPAACRSLLSRTLAMGRPQWNPHLLRSFFSAPTSVHRSRTWRHPWAPRATKWFLNVLSFSRVYGGLAGVGTKAQQQDPVKHTIYWKPNIWRYIDVFPYGEPRNPEALFRQYANRLKWTDVTYAHRDPSRTVEAAFECARDSASLIVDQHHYRLPFPFIAPDSYW